jgi:hypothetical protein
MERREPFSVDTYLREKWGDLVREWDDIDSIAGRPSSRELEIRVEQLESKVAWLFEKLTNQKDT